MKLLWVLSFIVTSAFGSSFDKGTEVKGWHPNSSIHKLSDDSIVALTTGNWPGGASSYSYTNISYKRRAKLDATPVKSTALEVSQYYSFNRFVETAQAIYLYSQVVVWNHEPAKSDEQGDRIVKVDKETGVMSESPRLSPIVNTVLSLKGCRGSIEKSPTLVGTEIYVPIFGDCKDPGQKWKTFKAFIVLDENLNLLKDKHVAMQRGVESDLAAVYKDNLLVDPKSGEVFGYTENYKNPDESIVTLRSVNGSSREIKFDNKQYGAFYTTRAFQTEKFWIILRGDEQKQIWLIDKSTQQVQGIGINFPSDRGYVKSQGTVVTLPNGEFVVTIPRVNDSKTYEPMTMLVYFDRSGKKMNSLSVPGCSEVSFENNRQFVGTSRVIDDILYLETRDYMQNPYSRFLHAFSVGGGNVRLLGSQRFFEKLVPSTDTNLNFWQQFFINFDAVESGGPIVVGFIAGQNGVDLGKGTQLLDSHLQSISTLAQPILPVYFDGSSLVGFEMPHENWREAKLYKYQK